MVTGFDHTSDSDHLFPAIATVEKPLFKMGYEACGCLLDGGAADQECDIGKRDSHDQYPVSELDDEYLQFSGKHKETMCPEKIGQPSGRYGVYGHYDGGIQSSRIQR